MGKKTNVVTDVQGTNVAEETNVTNQAVTSESIDTETSATNTANIVENTKTFAQIAEILVKQNSAHKVINNIILSAHARKEVTKDGKSFYINLETSFQNPLPYFDEKEDGTISLENRNTLLFSVYNVINSLKREMFYIPIIARLSQDFTDDADSNPNPRNINNYYISDDYFSGIPCSVFCQFVEAGEVAVSPFARNGEPYEVKQYPRYIYHLLGVGVPVSQITISNIDRI